MTPSLFLKIKFSRNKTKSEFRHLVGTHRAKCGVHKMATPLGTSRGLNLNSIEANVAFD